MLTVTKRFKFDFSHKLPGYKGPCGRLHGHRGVLEVEVSGPPKQAKDIYPSMVVDFKDLKKIVEDKVVSKLDHNHLNEILEIPTAENIVLWIVDQLKEDFGDSLIRVRFYETEDSYAEWRKEL